MAWVNQNPYVQKMQKVTNHDATLDPGVATGVTRNRPEYDGGPVYGRNGPGAGGTLNRESSLPAITGAGAGRQRNASDLLGSPLKGGNKYADDSLTQKYNGSGGQRNNFGQVHSQLHVPSGGTSSLTAIEPQNQRARASAATNPDSAYARVDKLPYSNATGIVNGRNLELGGSALGHIGVGPLQAAPVRYGKNVNTEKRYKSNVFVV